ncbi:MAG: hypothetical protein D6741_20995 [Planctomycetota bacterium]|nr:MAG: hypothetical protein D6741_20995 [Planctomycetota bacterium]
MRHRPTVHNPFPQLAKVAVAPFFNLSSEPTVDGRRFANAYYNELQQIPGFEVIPVSVVEQAMRTNNINLTGAAEARRLAQILGADAVVIGAITEYDPYYPPRLGLQVEWYAANPGFHPIPPGYGLPWGTAEEAEIPDRLVFEAEFALAREQLATQTPQCPMAATNEGTESPVGGESDQAAGEPVRPAGYAEPISRTPVGTIFAQAEQQAAALPADWPDPRGLVPPGPKPTPAPCLPSDEPVLRHTKIYHGNDPDFTAALAEYYDFRNEARFGGWQAYLERSDDFIRFCCRMHIWEMLTARGGAGKSEVVWRFPNMR